jgi:sugar phosphate isomerase/epimerase
LLNRFVFDTIIQPLTGEAMRICASSICWAHHPLAEALQKARAAGFTAFEVLCFPREIWDLHGDLREIRPREYKKIFDDHGIELIGLHLGAIMTPTEERRRVLTDYAKRAIDVAEEIGVKIIVEGGPDRAGQAFHPFLDSLEELAKYLDGKDVKIALENHYGNWIQFIQDYEFIFDRIDSPSIGITLDTGHFTSAGVDPAEVAHRFANKIYHVHIKDHIGTRSVPLGTGQTENKEMVQVLKAAGYDGYLSQELEVEKDHDKYACEGFSYMKSLIEQ